MATDELEQLKEARMPGTKGGRSPCPTCGRMYCTWHNNGQCAIGHKAPELNRDCALHGCKAELFKDSNSMLLALVAALRAEKDKLREALPLYELAIPGTTPALTVADILRRSASLEQGSFIRETEAKAEAANLRGKLDAQHARMVDLADDLRGEREGLARVLDELRIREKQARGLGAFAELGDRTAVSDAYAAAIELIERGGE